MATSVASITVKDYLQAYRDADRFIELCKECQNYGTCWVCPPYDFNTTTLLTKYANAYIIGTIITPDAAVRSNSIDETKRMSHMLLADARTLIDEKLLMLESVYADSCSFFAGTCFACPNESCTRILGKPCFKPDKIRYSLEAFGFDIGKTASELLQVELKWSHDGMLPEYFTLVSGFFSNQEINAATIESAIGREHYRALP